MTIKELKNILEKYDENMIISFIKWDHNKEIDIDDCSVDIGVDKYKNNTLNITVL